MPSKTPFVLGVLALCAAAYAGTSHWLGQQVEQRHQAFQEQAQQQLTPIGARLDAQLQRGWFSSSVRNTLQLPLNPLQPQAGEHLSIEWQDQIRHGPWAGGGLASAHISSRITRIEGLSPAWQRALDQAGRPEFEGRVGLNGALDGRMRWPASRLELPLQEIEGRLSLQWDTLVLDLHTQGEPEQLHSQTELRWPEVRAQLGSTDPSDESQISLQLRGLHISGQTQMLDGLWLFAPSRSKLQLEQADLNWSIPGANLPLGPAQLRKLQIGTHTHHQDGRINHDTQLSTQLRWSTLELNALNYENQLHGLNAEVLRQAQALLMEVLQAAREQRTPDIQPDTAQELIQRLLETPPEWRERYRARTGDGAEGKLAWSIHLANPSPEQARLPWPLTLPQRLRGDAQVQLPKVWLEHTQALPAEAQAQIQALLQSGLWQDAGEHWRLEGRYDAKGLQINGQSLGGF